MLIVGGALVHALIRLCFVLAADVDDQRAGVGPHAHPGVLVYVEMCPVPRPGEAAAQWCQC